MDNTNYRCFAPCPRGLEALLQQELTALGATDLRPTEGGVGFSGDLKIIYRANLESRIASRILLEVAHVPYRNEQDIYVAASALPYSRGGIGSSSSVDRQEHNLRVRNPLP